jgi:release factor glutamine methyltransferase
MGDRTDRLRRAAWRTWYRARWLGWQRRSATRARLRRVAGFEVVVLPGVLDPAWFLSSEVMVDALGEVVRPGSRVLDLGTGCGIGALAAARAGAGTVVATDVDPVAVRCARINVLVAAVDVDVRHGDLFAPVEGERFDVVAFNPPWLPVAPRELARALRLDPAVPARFAAELPDHLTPTGQAMVVLSTNGRPEAWLGPLRSAGFRLDEVLQRDRGSETLTVWRARSG